MGRTGFSSLQFTESSLEESRSLVSAWYASNVFACGVGVGGGALCCEMGVLGEHSDGEVGGLVVSVGEKS